jgi:hypothetical protein
MIHNYVDRKAEQNRLCSLRKIIDICRSNIFFIVHLGYSQWEVETPSRSAKPHKIQSINPRK